MVLPPLYVMVERCFIRGGSLTEVLVVIVSAETRDSSTVLNFSSPEGERSTLSPSG